MKGFVFLVIVFIASNLVADSTTEVKNVILLKNGAKLEVIEDIFDAKKFNIEYRKDDSRIIEYINGRIPYGVDFGTPKTYAKSIELYYKGKTYNLDSSDMYNALETKIPRPKQYSKLSVNHLFGIKCANENNCVIRGILSQGSSSFAVEWEILNGKSRRTIMTFSKDIILFMLENIEPDVYLE
ncbi:hypothetical protein FACS189487_10140 [Campylobacterota bacterium]|nr:hypothetical protein FACS189487_10140 [Campylobacterota bacterium]